MKKRILSLLVTLSVLLTVILSTTTTFAANNTSNNTSKDISQDLKKVLNSKEYNEKSAKIKFTQDNVNTPQSFTVGDYTFVHTAKETIKPKKRSTGREASSLQEKSLSFVISIYQAAFNYKMAEIVTDFDWSWDGEKVYANIPSISVWVQPIHSLVAYWSNYQKSPTNYCQSEGLVVLECTAQFTGKIIIAGGWTDIPIKKYGYKVRVRPDGTYETEKIG